MASEPPRRRRALRLGIGIAFGAAIGTLLFVLPVRELLTRFLDAVARLGPYGPVVIGAAYIPATVLFIPGSLITLGAGFVCGVLWGTVAVSIGSTVGAAAAFWVGRYLARGFVAERISRYPRFAAIERAIGKHGFKIVLLTRLSPIFPFTFLNYAFGVTRVRFRDYLVASWIGMLPGTVMYVYLGSLAKSLTALAAGRVERGSLGWVLFGVGLAATVAVVVVVTRVARRALAEATGEATPEATHA